MGEIDAIGPVGRIVGSFVVGTVTTVGSVVVVGLVGVIGARTVGASVPPEVGGVVIGRGSLLLVCEPHANRVTQRKRFIPLRRMVVILLSSLEGSEINP
jgi:hypothetical protein